MRHNASPSPSFLPGNVHWILFPFSFLINLAQLILLLFSWVSLFRFLHIREFFPLSLHQWGSSPLLSGTRRVGPFFLPSSPFFSRSERMRPSPLFPRTSCERSSFYLPFPVMVQAIAPPSLAKFPRRIFPGRSSVPPRDSPNPGQHGFFLDVVVEYAVLLDLSSCEYKRFPFRLESAPSVPLFFSTK